MNRAHNALGRAGGTSPSGMAVWLLMASLACGLMPAAVEASCTNPPGDITGDSKVNVADAQCGLVAALTALDGAVSAPPCAGADWLRTDQDCDGDTNIADVLGVVRMALGLGLPSSIDSNADGCNDACNAEIAEACCVEGLGVGCGHGGCEGCVCAADDYCCSTQWDASCAALAGEDCAVACLCDPGGGGETGCCAVHSEPGCSDAACEAAVCALDSFCCDLGWDLGCVECASTGVGAAGIDCTSAVGPCGCPEYGACCILGTCIESAQTTCDAFGGAFSSGATCADADGDEVADVCDVTPATCPYAGGSCTADNGTPGCDDVPCCDAVCDAEPICCEVAWDTTCAGIALDTCINPSACCRPQGCSMEPPLACEATGGVPSTGQSCADDDSNGTADACQAEAVACCLPGGCQMLAPAGCAAMGGASATGQTCADLDATGVADACESWACCTGNLCTLSTQAQCSTAGGTFAPGYGCGDQDDNGVADVCDDAGCCVPQAGGGCPSQPVCSACVCGIDSYCCDTSWDPLCAACAAGEYCGTPPQPSTACSAACSCEPAESMGACCAPAGGQCAPLTATQCEASGGQHLAGFGCGDLDDNGEPDACELHACCTASGCSLTNAPTCLALGGGFAFGSDCSDSNGTGGPDACE